MSTSAIRKSTPTVRLDGVLAGVGGGQIRIPLKKESLVAEMQVRVQAAQPFAGAAPTGSDVRRFITNVAIETSDGRKVFATGYQAYDLGRFTEQAPAPVVALGAGGGANATADYTFDIHFENDEALHDLFSAIAAGKLTTFDLVLDMAADNANGFTGGVGGVTNYTVTARSQGFPDMLFVRAADGTMQPNPIVGAFDHRVERVTLPGNAGAGTSFDLRLISGNLSRFLMLHTFDTGTGLPSDAVLNNLRLIIDGKEIFIGSFLEQRKQNAQKRAFNIPGCVVIDFGDDESGWLNLVGINEPKLTVDIAAGAPANWLVTLAQDYSVKMK